MLNGGHPETTSPGKKLSSYRTGTIWKAPSPLRSSRAHQRLVVVLAHDVDRLAELDGHVVGALPIVHVHAEAARALAAAVPAVRHAHLPGVRGVRGVFMVPWECLLCLGTA